MPCLRKFALDTPSLWTHPLFSRTEVAEAMTSRAKDLPLTVKCNLTPSGLKAVVSVLQTRPLRFVFLSGIPQRLKEAYNSLASDLPHLQILKFEADLPSERRDLEDDEDEIDMDNDNREEARMHGLTRATARPCDLGTVVRGKIVAPNLSKVSLYSTWAPVNCGLLDHVTSFQFTMHWGSPDSPWLADKTLEAISHLRTLIILDLDWLYEGQVTWTHDNSKTDFWPELREIRLCIPPDSRRALLRSVKSTVLENLKILMIPDFASPRDRQSEIPRLLAELEKTITSYGPPTALRLKDADLFDEGNNNYLQWERDTSLGVITLSAYCKLGVAFIPRQGEAYLATRPLFSQFTSVHYDNPDFVKSEARDMVTLFSWQPQITHVSLMGFRAAHKLLAALISHLDRHAALFPPLLSHLTHVSIRYSWDWMEEDVIGSEEVLPGAIEAYMSHRVARGLPGKLDILEIKDSWLPVGSWNQYHALHDYVQEIVVTLKEEDTRPKAFL
jgi:hypothetical protein